MNPLDGEPDEEEEESPEVNEAEVEVMDEEDDGESWMQLLLIPIFEPIVFLTILSSMLPYFSLTIILVLVESIITYLFCFDEESMARKS